MFSVISSILIRRVLPLCRKAVGVFYSPSWQRKYGIEWRMWSLSSQSRSSYIKDGHVIWFTYAQLLSGIWGTITLYLETITWKNSITIVRWNYQVNHVCIEKKSEIKKTVEVEKIRQSGQSLSLASSSRADGIESFDSFLSSIPIGHLGKSSTRHKISLQSWWMQVFTSVLMGRSQQENDVYEFIFVALAEVSICFNRIVHEIRGKWPYSCCFMGCCLQDLFKPACSILV